MGWNDEDDDRRYAVVINHEEQYSIWPAGHDVPDGWKAVGTTGTKRECVDYIEEVWTDMRPLSFRRKMAQLRDKGG
ncbi:MAG: MbtH family protein [Ilumatobacter sp.]|nr:MbtH family protein [Ilumatobacter sp.]